MKPRGPPGAADARTMPAAVAGGRVHEAAPLCRSDRAKVCAASTARRCASILRADFAPSVAIALADASPRPRGPRRCPQTGRSRAPSLRAPAHRRCSPASISDRPPAARRPRQRDRRRHVVGEMARPPRTFLGQGQGMLRRGPVTYGEATSRTSASRSMEIAPCAAADGRDRRGPVAGVPRRQTVERGRGRAEAHKPSSRWAATRHVSAHHRDVARGSSKASATATTGTSQPGRCPPAPCAPPRA